MKQSTWQHANGNMLAIVDCETTGLRCGYNEIIQLAVIPVNSDLNMMGIEPFVTYIMPEKPDNISPMAMKVNGIKSEELVGAPNGAQAYFIFQKWFERNVTANGWKKIIPIGQNLNFDKGFIDHWMGWDEMPDKKGKCNPEYNWSEDFFEWRKSRDTKFVAEYFNDLAYFNNIRYPFPRTSLGYLAKRFGINTEGAHDAVFDCLMTAKVYRNFLALRLGSSGLDFKAVEE